VTDGRLVSSMSGPCPASRSDPVKMRSSSIKKLFRSTT
jgi:hypothetical protein